MSYYKEIKPSTCTIFPIGSKVKITNSGRCYSGYKDMSAYLGLDHNSANPFRNGEVGVVIGKAMHESIHYGEVLAVRVAGGVALIGVNGVAEYEEPKPAVSELEALKTELATVKAKLWEAEWKLNKIVDVVKAGIL